VTATAGNNRYAGIMPNQSHHNLIEEDYAVIMKCIWVKCKFAHAQ
jgi:hypothetical protein